MGSRQRLDPTVAAVASIVTSLVDADPQGSVLDRVGRVAASVIERCRLKIDPATTPIGLSGPTVELDDELVGPEIIGLVYEQLIAAPDRHRRGAHFTPPSVAAGLVRAATFGWRFDSVDPNGGGSVPPVIVDPSCGGGAFLLASARWLVSAGVSPLEAASLVTGVDISPDAVAVSQLSLAIWLAGTESLGLSAVAVDSVGSFMVGDALRLDWPPASLVVGNPPFLSQLAASTARGGQERHELRERFGDAVGAYTDPAWLFLLAALQATRRGGRVLLIQPTSLLSARDGRQVRRRLLERAELVGLWLANERIFHASVDVWAPILAPVGDRPVIVSRPTLWTGRGVVEAQPPAHWESQPPAHWEAQPPAHWEAQPPAHWKAQPPAHWETQPPAHWEAQPPAHWEAQPPARSQREPSEDDEEYWTSLCADIVGVPQVTWPSSSHRIGDRAVVTAGFRDQFYGFVPYTVERGDDERDEDAFPRLITVGMIDPLHLRWGTDAFRFAGSVVTEPVVDRFRLSAGQPSVAGWLDQRLRPKLLVATQTKVLEVVVDTAGTLVPATPCLSVEPLDADPSLLWELAAVLTSPAATVIAKRTSMGAALSADAIKISAKAVAALPLPEGPRRHVERAAAAARRAFEATNGEVWSASLDEIAASMASAYGVGSRSDALNAWWRSRRPAWR